MRCDALRKQMYSVYRFIKSIKITDALLQFRVSNPTCSRDIVTHPVASMERNRYFERLSIDPRESDGCQGSLRLYITRTWYLLPVLEPEASQVLLFWPWWVQYRDGEFSFYIYSTRETVKSLKGVAKRISLRISCVTILRYCTFYL